MKPLSADIRNPVDRANVPPLPGLAVVVPCYNAGTRVRSVAARTLELVEHVLLVNDGSTDGCVTALDGLALHVIAFPENRGKGAALLAGFRAALDMPGVTCVAVVDADGQHDPGELPRLYKAYEDRNADLVIGARVFDREDVPWRSRVGNVMTARLVARLFHCQLPDTQSGLRLHSARFLHSILQTISAGRYETEMAIILKAIREDYAIVSVPVKTIYEKGNPSSHFRAFRDSWRVWRTLLAAALRR